MSGLGWPASGSEALRPTSDQGLEGIHGTKPPSAGDQHLAGLVRAQRTRPHRGALHVTDSAAAVRRLLFGIGDREITVVRRRFRPGTPAVGERLETIGRAFVYGYHTALDAAQPISAAERLGVVAEELRGFAFEGAAMALTILDVLTLGGGSRFARFVEGPAANHTYMAHIGHGWALARLGRRLREPIRFGELSRWLVIDGVGFHQGFFHWPAAIDYPRQLRDAGPYAVRAYDQGLGRSLWFVEGATPIAISRTISSFERARRADLWSGVGLAAAYAGGVGTDVLVELRGLGAGYGPELAQGAAFAAKARIRAGIADTMTSRACEVLCGASAAEAAAATDAALIALPDSAYVPSYEIWRQRIASRFAAVAA